MGPRPEELSDPPQPDCMLDQGLHGGAVELQWAVPTHVIRQGVPNETIGPVFGHIPLS